MSSLNTSAPEHPDKLTEFKNVLSGLKWDAPDKLGSLNELFTAVDSLAEAEVRYYFRRRITSRTWSTALRFGSWLFGTLGVLTPLLATTNFPSFWVANQPPSGSLIPWGYFFLAVAAALLGANTLFGATAGHVRFASTQLLLEKIMTVSRIAWCEYLNEAKNSPTEEAMKACFDFIGSYAEAMYSATLSETGNWSEMVIAELNRYASEIARQRKTADTASKPKSQTRKTRT
jgi:hypothetical protein